MVEVIDAYVAESVRNTVASEVLEKLKGIAEKFGYPCTCGAPSMTCLGIVGSLKMGHLFAGIT